MNGYSADAAMTAWLNLIFDRIAILVFAAAAGALLVCGAGVVLARVFRPVRRRRRANHLCREARRGIRHLERYLADHDASR